MRFQSQKKWRRVRDVRGVHAAATGSEEAADTPTAVNDDRTRIAAGREGPRVFVIGEDSPLPRPPGSAVVRVRTDVGEDTGRAADGDTSGSIALYD